MTLPAISLPPRYRATADCLRDRVVLVTGAGQGLGRAAALACAAHGAVVMLHGRDANKLAAVYDSIVAAGGAEPALLTLDLATAAQPDLDGMAQAVHRACGRLDGIVHAASHFVSTMPMALYDLEAWNLHTRVNLSVPAALTRACLPMLKRAPDGSVVFLTETHALQPRAYWGPFAAAKAALANLVAAWSDEFSAPPGPRFNLLLPGPVASPMRAQSHPGELATTLPGPDALADAFLYLLGPDSHGVTGRLLDWR